MDLLRHEYLPEALDFLPGSSEKVFTLLLELVTCLRCRGDSVVCEGLFISQERRARLRAVAPPQDALFIYITASLDVLLSRLSRRQAAQLDSESLGAETLTPDALRAHAAASRPPSHGAHVVDTSGSSVAESAMQVDALISKTWARGRTGRDRPRRRPVG